MVGKYVDLHDTYKSIDEALVHAGMGNEVRVRILKIDAEKLEKGTPAADLLGTADGILVPGGFGERGVEGMIIAARYARESKKPYFGICLGMQIMVIEFARSVLGLEGANSTEFNPQCANPVVSLLEEQEGVTKMGGTMRLGKSATHTLAKTKIREAYGTEIVWERHRHRYEVDNRYKAALETAGLKISGFTPDGTLVESTEWAGHPWSTGVQFHPEFTSKPTAPQPLFQAFVKASAG
jgi:CTP synthase